MKGSIPLRHTSLLTLGLLLALGCAGASTRCTTGASVPCACTDGRSGAQVCGSDGAFNTCVCKDATAGGGAGGGTVGGGSAADGGNATGGGTAGGAVADGGAGSLAVVVVFKWVWFESSTTCAGGPVTCMVVNACPPSNCDCVGCASGQGCIPSVITPKCCAVSATILEADLSKLVQDYPTCRLNQTSPRTYDLDCPASSTSNTYWTGIYMKVRGADLKYTQDATCRWSLPYARDAGP